MAHGFLNYQSLRLGDAGEDEEVGGSIVAIDFLFGDGSEEANSVADFELAGKVSAVLSVRSFANQPQFCIGAFGENGSGGMKEKRQVFLFGQPPDEEEDLVVQPYIEFGSNLATVEQGLSPKAGRDDADGGGNGVSAEPLKRGF